MARTRWILGFQRRLVRTWECDTDIPHEGRLLQISQTAAMARTSFVPESILSQIEWRHRRVGSRRYIPPSGSSKPTSAFEHPQALLSER